MQPQSVGTTPLALLALGAAGRGPPPAPIRRSLAPVAAVLAGAGMLAGGILLLGDASLQQARLDLDGSHIDTADALLRPWPPPATVAARIELFAGLEGRDASRDAAARRWRREAVARAPDDPALWIELAEGEEADRPG